MTGRTLAPLLRGESQPGRDRVFVERERHANVRRGDLSYPVRAIRTADYLPIRNFRLDRWPAGDLQQYVAVGPFGDIDGGPSKSLLLDRQSDQRSPVLPTRHRERQPRSYDLRRDPHQIQNVAGQPEHREAQKRLRADLDRWLKETGDPRVTKDDDRWDRFPYWTTSEVDPRGWRRILQFRRLRVRHDKRADIHEAFLSLGCALICWQSLRKT